MKTIRLLTLLAISLGCFTAPVFAAPAVKAAKNAQAQAKPKEVAKIIARYDKDKNGAIDADEVAPIQKAFATDPDLRQFDKNGDGKLDETEVSAINPTPKKKKK